MPQLNPEPWFLILVLSWMVFLILIPPKILAHHVPNEPNNQNTKKEKTGTWNWLWQ